MTGRDVLLLVAGFLLGALVDAWLTLRLLRSWRHRTGL